MSVKLSQLKGVGPKVETLLNKLGIVSIYDLLFQLPLRYEDRQTPIKIGHLQPNQSALVLAQVQSASVMFGKKRSLLVKVKDETGTIGLRFYHFSQAQKEQFNAGVPIKLFGEIRTGATGLEMYHPEYELGGSNSNTYNYALENTPTYTPIYPLTEGLTQLKIRLIHQQAYDLLESGVLIIPEVNLHLDQIKHLPSLKDALLFIHAPPKEAGLAKLKQYTHPAQKRLIIEELIAQQLGMLKIRAQIQKERAPNFSENNTLYLALKNSLTFELTQAQQRVIGEIHVDLTQSIPMLRLLQGDVGSCKTLVAALSACPALESNYQVALMAPTELLAEQLFHNFERWFTPLTINIGWLSGKTKGKVRSQVLDKLKSGQINLIVGTHALFQKDVEFKNLGLVIIDEQHRFGVNQRLALREKGQHAGLIPHQLVMTATPIPRTLAMSAYADLNLSIIDELPPGRTPVTTSTINNLRRDEVIQRIGDTCEQAQQAYWVCTLIEESEALQCEAAENSFEYLKKHLPNLRLGLIHGRMKADEKNQVMQAFKTHKLDVLVATTVIEVGVDVPNASLMVIENPERLGLSQLHQLRGRVGRGQTQSHCILLYSSPLSLQAKQRLSILKQSQDGFFIAEQDLLLRGPGELLGTRQTGIQQLRIADLERDADLLEAIQPIALTLFHHQPDNAKQLLERWVGHSERFSKA